MSATRYIAGVMLLATTMGATLWIGSEVCKRAFPTWKGAIACLTKIAVALVWLILAAELLGAVGELHAVSLTALGIASALLLRAVFARLPRQRVVDPRNLCQGRLPDRHFRHRISNAAAAGAVCALVLTWALPTIRSLRHGMLNFDTLWYHMPFAAQFAQTGTITQLHYTQADPLIAFYPANSELLHSVALQAFGSDALSPLFNLGWLGLALLAGWCVGSRWGVGAESMLGVALVLAVPVMTGSQPGQASNDVMTLALFLTALSFISHSDGRHAALLLAVAVGGLAVGSKLSALGAVAAVAVATLFASPRKTRGLYAVTAGAILFLTGGFWYVRNGEMRRTRAIRLHPSTSASALCNFPHRRRR